MAINASDFPLKAFCIVDSRHHSTWIILIVLGCIHAGFIGAIIFFPKSQLSLQILPYFPSMQTSIPSRPAT